MFSSFDVLGARFTAFTKLQDEQPKVTFRLSLPQTGKFNEFFAAEKDHMQELNGERYSARFLRLAWCFLRIAMVLTSLWLMDTRSDQGKPSWRHCRLFQDRRYEDGG